MMDGQNVPQTSPPASVSHLYVMVSLTALAIMLMVLLQWMGRWSFLPVLIGVMGVILRWRLTESNRSILDRRITRLMSPLLTLLLLAGLLLASDALPASVALTRPQPGGLPTFRFRFNLSDWLLSGAVLAFCLAQYRFEAITLSIIPEDYTKQRPEPLVPPVARQPQQSKTNPQARNPQLVTPLEIGWLLLSLPLWAFVAQLCCWLVSASVPPQGSVTFMRRGIMLEPLTYVGVVLLWPLVLGVLVVAGVLSYVGQRRLREREARLFLQDALWQETSREQRRLNRWLAWAGLRRRRKEKR